MEGGLGDPSADPQLAALTEAWSARGIASGQLIVRSDGTLTASDRRLTVDSATLGIAGEAVDAAGIATDEPLEVTGTIGRGGMGVVERGTQQALRREVAIKRRLDRGAPLDTLLKEAWVAGALEHPNVVPVHVLARVGGEPAVVMKRIEGVPWSRALRDPSLVPEADRADAIAWHVRILIQVCHAVSLAHRRGILHLDLKPENVMIGAFGEVHVLDWGLAAGHGAAAPPWLARADQLRGIAGTPDYMAPELATGAGDRISPRTDVYLLGAILHEILTGKPPHAADHVVARLYLAFQSAPKEYGPEISTELRDLLHRAMHRDAEARHPSADAFRAALEDHLAHRAADDLVREARAQLAALEAMLSEPHADPASVLARFGACRFALAEAGAGRRDHPDIPPLRRTLFRAMAGWALDERRADLARAWLDELGEPAPELEARLEALRASAEADAARVRALEALAEDESLAVGSAFRRRLAIALGAIFVVVNVAMAIAARRGLVVWDYPELLTVGMGSLAVLGPYALLDRRRIFRNRANTVLFAVCIATYFVVEGFLASMWQLGVPAARALPLSAAFYFFAFGSMAVLLSARFVPSVLVQIPTTIAAAAWPEHALEIIGVGGGLSAALIGITWRADPAQGAER